MMSMVRKRSGFTLLEVLTAALVLMIALLGISAAAAGLLKKSKSPNQVETGALLANERLSYFRAQNDPFRAVGGTQYLPPAMRGDPDWTSLPAANNNYNCNVDGASPATNAPTLFARDYLFAPNEGEMRGPNDASLQVRDLGRIAQDRNVVNTVPDLPALVARVVADPDGGAVVPAYPANFTPGSLGVFVAAPRANAAIRAVLGTPLPPAIGYVREVWVQTNHPEFGSGAVAASALLIEPNIVRFLPPYTVAVTVKTFARIPIVTSLAQSLPVRAGTGAYTNAPSLGYDPSRPLAEMVGFFGLRRWGS